MPLRIFGVWAVSMGLLAPLGHWYTKRTPDRAEVLARTKRIVIALIALNGAFLMQHFADICRTSAPCRAGIDLNCSGLRPAMYQWGVAPFVVVALVALFAESWRRMHPAR
jgi:hypothetical protein